MVSDVKVSPPYEEGKSEDKPGHRKFASYSLPGWVRHPKKIEPLKVALLFPGEQNHSVGMLEHVRRKPAVRQMLETATEALGFDVEELMLEGPAADMAKPGVNQALIYVADCAAFEILKETTPEVAERCQGVAGLGVGEYAALYAAGVITFRQGLDIVKVRAAALEALADEGAMEVAVVRGMELDKLERHLKTAQKSDTGSGADKPEVYISQYSCPDGYLCAGRRSTVLKLLEVIGGDADVEARLLPDHLPAVHTPLAKEAAAKVGAVLDRLAPIMKPPRCEVYLNQTGMRVPPGRSPFAFLEVLKSQLVEPVQWENSVTQMLNWGVRQFYECGPNRSLKFLMGLFEHYIEAPIEILRPADFTLNVTV